MGFYRECVKTSYKFIKKRQPEFKKGGLVTDAKSYLTKGDVKMPKPI